MQCAHWKEDAFHKTSQLCRTVFYFKKLKGNYMTTLLILSSTDLILGGVFFSLCSGVLRNKFYLWCEALLSVEEQGNKLGNLQTELFGGKEDISHEIIMTTALPLLPSGNSDVLETEILKGETRSPGGYESFSYTNLIAKGQRSDHQESLAENLPEWRLQD